MPVYARMGMRALRMEMRALRGLETGSYKVTLRPASVIARRQHALSGAATA